MGDSSNHRKRPLSPAAAENVAPSSKEPKTSIEVTEDALKRLVVGWTDEEYNSVSQYLMDNAMSEEDPILCVSFDAGFDTTPRVVNGAAQVGNIAAVQAALQNAAGAANNIRGLGVAFHFTSQERLLLAKANLGDPTRAINVSWAYKCSQATANQLIANGGTIPAFLIDGTANPRPRSCTILRFTLPDEISHAPYDFFLRQ